MPQPWLLPPQGRLPDQLCRLSPCRQSTADIIGEAFRRQTGDLNKYSCIQLSCSGGEFSVNKLVLCACRPLDLLPFLGEMNVIDVDYSSLRLMFLRCDIDYKALSYQRRSRGRRCPSLIGCSIKKLGCCLARLAHVPICPTRWFVASFVSPVNGRWLATRLRPTKLVV